MSRLYLQSLIKRLGQERGFKTTIEEPVAGGIVDAVLQNENERIACEISVTTSPEHEWQNIQKCIDAEFDHIILLAHEKPKLNSIKQHVQSVSAEQSLDKVRFLLPQEFIAFLDECNANAAGTEKTVRGYKVKVSYSATDQTAQKQKQEAIAKLIVESMRRMK